MSKWEGTKNCVYCLKRSATSWCGHVLKDEEKLLAGWCHLHSPGTGFVGHYKKNMGRLPK